MNTITPDKRRILDASQAAVHSLIDKFKREGKDPVGLKPVGVAYNNLAASIALDGEQEIAKMVDEFNRVIKVEGQPMM